MRPINGYNEATVNDRKETIIKEPIALVVRIRGVENVVEKQYLKIYFDVAQKGELLNAFSKASNNVLASWDNQGVYFLSQKETAVRLFKGFITSVEESNQGYTWDWNENGLVGKLFVAVYGKEYYLNKDLETKIRLSVRQIRSVKALQEGKVTVPTDIQALSKKDQAKLQSGNNIIPNSQFVGGFGVNTNQNNNSYNAPRYGEIPPVEPDPRYLTPDGQKEYYDSKAKTEAYNSAPPTQYPTSSDEFVADDDLPF